MTDSHSASGTEAKSQSDKPSTIRLVIRARILPDEPAHTAAPRSSNRGALAVIVGAAVLALIWIGISVFRSEPENAEPQLPATEPASSVAVPKRAEPPPRPAASPAETKTAGPGLVEPESTQAQTPEPGMRDEPDASPSPIKEVLPNPSRSALRTIQGTIRVSVRVTIDKQGTVTAATPEDAGPSRYFERLSVESAKKWKFTPVNDGEQRTKLLRFHFTRERTTARVDN